MNSPRTSDAPPVQPAKVAPTAGSSAWPAEPQPGERLSGADFEQVVRLTPLVSIDLVVRLPDGRALLGRRSNEPAKGKFFVVGGRITKNETTPAAFRRLTVLELGFEKELKQARFLGQYDHFYPTNALGKPGFGTHYVVLAYELKLAEKPTALPPAQHDDYVWRTPEEILNATDVHENTKVYFREGK